MIILCSNYRSSWGISIILNSFRDKKQAWKTQKAKIKRQVKALEEQISHLEQKRRHYSWQQAEGIINKEELQTAYKQIQSEESLIREQLVRLEDFKLEPEPLDLATFRKLAEFWTIDVISGLSNALDDVKARIAELFDLCATIHPDNSQDGYHCDLMANIPLEMEGDKPNGYDMVFSPSGGGPRVRIHLIILTPSPNKFIMASYRYPVWRGGQGVRQKRQGV